MANRKMLFEAVDAGDPKKVKRILAAGVSRKASEEALRRAEKALVAQLASVPPEMEALRKAVAKVLERPS